MRGEISRLKIDVCRVLRSPADSGEKPCSFAASQNVAYWPLATDFALQPKSASGVRADVVRTAMTRRSDECAPTLASQHRQDWRVVPIPIRLAKNVTIPSQWPLIHRPPGEPGRTCIYAAF